jgi:hypothetical protein
MFDAIRRVSSFVSGLAVQALIALLRTCNGREKSGIKSPKSAALTARSWYLIHIVQTGCE